VKKLLPESYFKTQERLCEWFEQLQSAVGCGANADTGAVLRAVESLAQKLKTYEEQQAAVAKSRGYRFWGDYYNAVLKELPEAKVVELPTFYNEVPLGWFNGPGKPSYDKCAKRLVTTQKVIRKTLGYVADQSASEDEGWEEQTKAELAELFTNSTSADTFERECMNFVYEVEPEPDPSTVWLNASERAGSLELDQELPTAAAFELLEFAEEKGVEVTKQQETFYEECASPSNWWFWHLLAAYLLNEGRPTNEQVTETQEDAKKAVYLGLLYLDGNNWQVGDKEGWALGTNLSQVAMAYNTYKTALSEGRDTHNDLAKEVLLALGKTKEASKV